MNSLKTKRHLTNIILKSISPLYKIAELEFENVTLLNESMSSPVGQEVQKDIANLSEFSPKPPVVSIIQ